MLDSMGTLYVVATPLGNLEDITLRAIKTLLTVPVIACEDTRHTGNLIKLLQDCIQDTPGWSTRSILVGSRRYISVRDWNEAEMVDKMMQELEVNDVALVSDAGTPLISDPGFKVVREARRRGFVVSPIPGPSAVIAALSVAGLPTDKFLFLGFVGKKWEIPEKTTTIIYESPIRAKAMVEKIKERYPTAQVMIAEELTKIHERISDYVSGKGEVVVLVYWYSKNVWVDL